MADPKNAPQPGTRLGQALSAQPQQTVDFRRLGRSGLALSSGYLLDEKVRALQGQRGMEAYGEMAGDSTIGTCLSLIERAARQAKWNVEPASQHPVDIEAANFLESCFHDMELGFSDMLADIVRGVPQFGFYLGALQYKRRAGNAIEPYLRSTSTDGRIGWRAIVGMGQETVVRWNVSEPGSDEFTSVTQCAPPLYQYQDIPYDRLLHIRQSTHKNSPIGISLLRACFKDWYIKVRVESFAAIGAERSVAGLPVIRVPPEVLAGITDEDKAMLAACQKIATNIRVDADGGIVFPMARDQNGELMYDIELMSTSSSQLMDLEKMISRLDYNIAASLNSEFIKLGSSGGATGSYSMHADKTDLHAQMINNLLSCVGDAFNRFAIPRLFALNNFQIDHLPELKFSDVGATNIKDMGAFLQSAAAAGAVLFPNPDAEDRIMELAGLPLLPRDDGAPPAMPPMGDGRPDDLIEVHEGDAHPEGGEAAVEAEMGNQRPAGAQGALW